MNGTYPFTVEVTDSQTVPSTKSAPLSIVINATVTQLNMVTTTLPAGTQNVGYSVVRPPPEESLHYIWSIAAGSLPPGLFFGRDYGSDHRHTVWRWNLDLLAAGDGLRIAGRSCFQTVQPYHQPGSAVEHHPDIATVGKRGHRLSAAVVVIGGDYPSPGRSSRVRCRPV